MSSEKKDVNVIKACLLLVVIIIWTAFGLVFYGLLTIIPLHKQESFIPVYHTILCKLMGVKIVQQGDISLHSSTLFVSNHVSYIDIPVLGSLIKAGFVAKSEIASWPVINHLARIQNTIFIERKASKAKAQINILRNRLSAKNSLILFPEGTSTSGAEVLPLKSSLFSAADVEEEVLIQPVSIVYSQHNGEGMNQDLRDYFAWYANFPFGAHFFKMLGMGTVTVVVSFNEPVRLNDFSSRKECAASCEKIMRHSFEQAFLESGSVKP